jgi:hypothetical protein
MVVALAFFGSRRSMPRQGERYEYRWLPDQHWDGELSDIGQLFWKSWQANLGKSVNGN